MSEIGPWAAVAQVVALGVIFLVWPRAASAASDTEEERREGRWFWGVASVWMMGGLLFAVGAGQLGLMEFRRHAMERVQLAAALMDKGPVTELLSERLELSDPFYVEGWTSQLRVAHSDHAGRHSPQVSAQLRQLIEAFPDARQFSVSTLRDGWLALVAFSANPLYPEQVTLVGRAGEEDLRDWNDRRERFISPRIVEILGWDVLARSPISSADGAMLGWLNLHYSVSDWVAAQVQRRAMAYVVVAFGLVIGRQLLRRRKVERDKTRADQQAFAATQANKLKTTFLANVSHELRTPLQTIMGYTDLLLPVVEGRNRKRLLAVREHADLMGRLVNDLIDLSAAESGNFQLVERPVALADLVGQTVESFRPQADYKGLSLNVHVAPQIPAWLKADPQRVRQVVLNLVSNAIKYTDHGEVDTSFKLVERRGDEVVLEFHVADTGPGIDPAEQAKLFSAFSRLDRTIEREGAGLGLAIVAAVCRAMRGSIQVESDGRSGTRFVARWRLETAPPPALEVRDNVPLSGMRVLIADDNALVRDLFVAYLTDCGATCATAMDGEEAVQRLHREAFEAVILDLAMPRLDGISTVRRLRQSMPEHLQRIVGVSAHASAADHQNALAAGMDAFLVKPVALSDLARALVPSIRDVPEVDTLSRIRSHFEQRFRADAALQSANVAQAWERGAWPEIRAAAHHLKNSADVIGDGNLARACADLEVAARAHDRSAGDDAWVSCKRALIRWLPESSEN